MPTVYSPDSATTAEILIRAKALLATGTGLDPSKVFIALANDAEPVPACKEQHVTVRFDAPDPDSYAGAGRRSTRTKRPLIVTVFTRRNTDQVRRGDTFYASAAGHYVVEDAVINTLHDKFIFADDTNARKLTAIPVHWMPGVQAAKTPTPEPGWGWSIFSFEVDYIQRMALDLTVGE